MTKIKVLTCEDSRRVEGVPLAAQPTVVLVPPAIVPAQANDVAVAARAPKDGSVEEDVGRIAIRLLLLGLGDEILVHVEDVEHLGVETDVTRLLETLQLLFTADRGFTFRKHRHETDFRQINFVKCNRTLVFFHDLPTSTDEGIGLNRGIAVEVRRGSRSNPWFPRDSHSC